MRRGRRRPVAVAAAMLVLLAAPAAAPAQQQQPNLTATNAILVETHTGDVVLQRKADERRPIASATKLMTALVAREQLALTDVIRAARYRALPVESKINLRAGERMQVADLLRGLLVASANDAAATLAEAVSGSTQAFVRDMNAHAKTLGLKDTHFANPVGLDASGNYSTARELTIMARKVLEDPFMAKVVNSPTATLKTGDRVRKIVNRNTLVRKVGYVTGVKTGHTIGAGYVLIGAGRRNGAELVSAVLGTPSEAAREQDTLNLLQYGFYRYRRRTVISQGKLLAAAPIKYRRGTEVEFIAGKTVKRVVRRGTKVRLRVLGAPTEVRGPLRAGQKVGEIQVRARGETIATVPLVAATTVAEATLPARARDWFTRPLALGLIVAAVLATVQLLFLYRRRARGRASNAPGQEVETA